MPSITTREGAIRHYMISWRLRWKLIMNDKGHYHSYYSHTSRRSGTPPSRTAIPRLLDLKEFMKLTSFEVMSLYLRLPTIPDPGH